MDYTCENCEFKGSLLKVKIYSLKYNEEKYHVALCNNCFPDNIGEYVDDLTDYIHEDLYYHKDKVEVSAFKQQHEEQYMEAFKNYQNLLLEMNELKNKLCDSYNDLYYLNKYTDILNTVNNVEDIDKILKKDDKKDEEEIKKWVDETNEQLKDIESKVLSKF